MQGTVRAFDEQRSDWRIQARHDHPSTARMSANRRRGLPFADFAWLFACRAPRHHPCPGRGSVNLACKHYTARKQGRSRIRGLESPRTGVKGDEATFFPNVDHSSLHSTTREDHIIAPARVPQGPVYTWFEGEKRLGIPGLKHSYEATVCESTERSKRRKRECSGTRRGQISTCSMSGEIAATSHERCIIYGVG